MCERVCTTIQPALEFSKAAIYASKSIAPEESTRSMSTESSKNKKRSEETFDWSGEAGDAFAEWNPSDAAGMDKSWMGYYGKSASDVFGAAVATAEKHGLDKKSAVVLVRGVNLHLCYVVFNTFLSPQGHWLLYGRRTLRLGELRFQFREPFRRRPQPQGHRGQQQGPSQVQGQASRRLRIRTADQGQAHGPGLPLGGPVPDAEGGIQRLLWKNKVRP